MLLRETFLDKLDKDFFAGVENVINFYFSNNDKRVNQLIVDFLKEIAFAAKNSEGEEYFYFKKYDHIVNIILSNSSKESSLLDSSFLYEHIKEITKDYLHDLKYINFEDLEIYYTFSGVISNSKYKELMLKEIKNILKIERPLEQKQKTDPLWQDGNFFFFKEIETLAIHFNKNNQKKEAVLLYLYLYKMLKERIIEYKNEIMFMFNYINAMSELLALLRNSNDEETAKQVCLFLASLVEEEHKINYPFSTNELQGIGFYCVIFGEMEKASRCLELYFEKYSCEKDDFSRNSLAYSSVLWYQSQMSLGNTSELIEIENKIYKIINECKNKDYEKYIEAIEKEKKEWYENAQKSGSASQKQYYEIFLKLFFENRNFTKENTATLSLEDAIDATFMDLLYLAKFIAKADSSQEISYNHFYKALSFIELNSKAKPVFKDHFDLDKLEILTGGVDYIQGAKILPTINFSLDLKILFESFQDKFHDEAIGKIR